MDVAFPADGGRVSEALGYALDRLYHVLFRLGFGAEDANLFQGHRRKHRPCPGAEVLRRELLAHVLLDVVIQPPAGETAEPVAVAVAEEPPPARRLEQLAHRLGELLVDDRRSDEDSVLGAETKADSLAVNTHVVLAQGRDPERPKALRVALVADSEPAQVDQPHRQRSGPFRLQRVETHVRRHRGAQIRELLGEAHQLVELRLLLPGAKLGVVEVLQPPRAVAPGRLQLRSRIGRDAHVAPGRWNAQGLDSLERVRIRDPAAPRVHVAEAPTRAEPPQSSSPRHRVSGCSRGDAVLILGGTKPRCSRRRSSS